MLLAQPQSDGLLGRIVVTAIKPVGNTVRILIDVNGNNLMAEVPSYMFEEMDLAVGKEVFLILRMRRIRCYESNIS